MLDDFLEVFLQEESDSSRAGESFTWEQFQAFFLLVMRNQTSYFRELYNGKKQEEIDLQEHMKENSDNIRVCFEAYDEDKSGYLCMNEVQKLLIELNLHKQFSKHFNPVAAFNHFCARVWQSFDKNQDG